jgi:type III pantothenate kinase
MLEVGCRLLLAVDVGNTNTSLGLFDGYKLKYQWRISTDRDRTFDETGMLFRSLFQSVGENMQSIKDAIICSVVPPVMRSFTNAILKYVGQKTNDSRTRNKTGINIKYENPREVGADKIVNAVGAVKLYGAPVIIVDFGTATTYCAINRNGDYLGGVICPGIKISAEALFDKAQSFQG